MLASKNARRAKEKGRNAFFYGLLTIISFIVFQTIGVLVVIEMNIKEFDMNLLNDPNKINEVQEQLLILMTKNFLRPLTVLLFSFGGYLLIRLLVNSLKSIRKEDNFKILDENEY